MGKPVAEHEWLAQLVGEWEWEGEVSPQPGQPPHKLTGVERVRSLSGMWFICESAGSHGDECGIEHVVTLGYDPDRGCYVGTWIGSMMSTLWVYQGQLDETRTRLLLCSDGPDCFDAGKISHYRDIVVIIDDDHRELHSEVQREDGEWEKLLVTRFRRTG